MESIFIKPNGEIVDVNDKDIYDFCKKECEKYVLTSIDNALYFSNCLRRYTYFNIYYDFVIHELKYIHKGYLLDKTKTLLDSMDKYSILIDTESINYQDIVKNAKQFILFNRADDINLDILGLYHDDMGFIDHNSIMLTTKNFYPHDNLAQVILSQLVIEDNDIYIDYINRVNKDYCDYLVTRLGFIKIGARNEYQVITYNPCFRSAKQRDTIYELIDYGCYEIEDYNNSEEDKKFVLDFRRKYENRRF